jgi:hypothetical protein
LPLGNSEIVKYYVESSARSRGLAEKAQKKERMHDLSGVHPFF